MPRAENTPQQLISLLFGVDATLSAMVVLAHNLHRTVQGRGLEPILDNIFMIVLLMVVFGSAALTTAIYHLAVAEPTGRGVRYLYYAASGAVGCAAFLALVGLARVLGVPGLVWQYPAAGVALGLCTALSSALPWAASEPGAGDTADRGSSLSRALGRYGATSLSREQCLREEQQCRCVQDT